MTDSSNQGPTTFYYHLNLSFKLMFTNDIATRLYKGHRAIMLVGSYEIKEPTRQIFDFYI